MINIDRFQEILVSYKKNFMDLWPEEKYKWEAVQHFQDHWNIHAQDFPAMLHEALDKTENLLLSRQNYPRGMIEKYAREEPVLVRSMFVDLFDESEEVFNRVDSFKTRAEQLQMKYPGMGKNHYQGENAITTYLWLRYPDAYYIYKYSEARAVSATLESDLSIKKGEYAANIQNSLILYSEISNRLALDRELVLLFQSQLTDGLYPDPKLMTLTVDFGYYLANRYMAQKTVESEWIHKNYSPGISVEQWLELLEDPRVFTLESLQILKRFKDFGGQATCAQLSKKYGASPNFYNRGASALAERVAVKTDCPLVLSEDENTRWWPILFMGKPVNRAGEEGSFIWKLRDELSEALDIFDLDHVELYAKDLVASKEGRQYWWLNASPKVWSFSSISVGEEIAYTIYNEAGNKRRIFQHFLDLKVGDLVVGYESNPVKQIVALATVVAEQDEHQVVFQKVEDLSVPLDYQELLEVKELEQMEYFAKPRGTLFKLTEDEYDVILELIRENNASPSVIEKKYDAYSKREFLDDVYMTEEKYDSLVALLKHKKNVILQGPPGVGKTFAARRLAHSIMEMKDDSRIEFIQFHQNYSYEDFMLGYKPVKEGFELRYGVFHQFCKRAENHTDKDYFFIIDEINRGNLSKIFGELLMLIENDYRKEKITLGYDGKLFSIPENVYLIGMMNTADRSLAMIDYALRRRFTFFEMRPGFDSDGFIRYQRGLDSEMFDGLINKVKELNRAIEAPDSLGKGFSIGHSYFCGIKTCTEEWMRSVINYEIIPLLNEYWFDDEKKFDDWSSQLLSVFQ